MNGRTPVTAQISPEGEFSNRCSGTNEKSDPITSTQGRPAAISDADLARKVVEALRRAREPALGKLHVTTRYGIVTLRGHVPNNYLKVLAMTTALTVAGAWWVVNCVDVSVSPS
jgi:osmotically-inducible protein OsmY